MVSRLSFSPLRPKGRHISTLLCLPFTMPKRPVLAYFKACIYFSTHFNALQNCRIN
uniref:Uncharacterized protein n=1 Tax=Siphoviridae sp. ctbxa26 TaxID=2825568 RepID=A0A8S5VF66_9CAUD|nr:MAG TPA: hypothetical protein [Siphoviridae sp. ctbxa26]DAG75355.1 MAG TPA: hypothetical protein [Caudoviricetes sp.]